VAPILGSGKDKIANLNIASRKAISSDIEPDKTEG
jgi:hypothetical protein